MKFFKGNQIEVVDVSNTEITNETKQLIDYFATALVKKHKSAMMARN